MTDNSHYCVCRGYVTTCNEDMSVPLNSRVVAVVDDPNNDDLHAMLQRANTQPELLAALEAMVEDYQEAYGGGDLDEEPSALKQARAAIAKAKS